MSSGHGVFTEKGRCYSFYKEFIDCRDQSPYPKEQCRLQWDDYFECLHHKKERERMIKIIKELRVKKPDSSSP